MVEAGNPDAKYTLKSGIYQSCFAAITEGGDRYDIVEKLLQAIPDCRVDAQEFQISFGMGWNSALHMLKVELAKILEPQFPPENFLAELDGKMAMKEWWSSYDKYLDEDEEYSDYEDEDEEESDDEDGDDETESSNDGSEDEADEESDEESDNGSASGNDDESDDPSPQG